MSALGSEILRIRLQSVQFVVVSEHVDASHTDDAPAQSPWSRISNVSTTGPKFKITYTKSQIKNDIMFIEMAFIVAILMGREEHIRHE